jgi:hypothetical protein
MCIILACHSGIGAEFQHGDVAVTLNERPKLALRKSVLVGTVLLDRANRIKWSSKRVCV